jgi:hypothetical protein
MRDPATGKPAPVPDFLRSAIMSYEMLAPQV